MLTISSQRKAAPARSSLPHLPKRSRLRHFFEPAWRPFVPSTLGSPDKLHLLTRSQPWHLCQLHSVREARSRLPDRQQDACTTPSATDDSCVAGSTSDLLFLDGSQVFARCPLAGWRGMKRLRCSPASGSRRRSRGNCMRSSGAHVCESCPFFSISVEEGLTPIFTCSVIIREYDILGERRKPD